MLHLVQRKQPRKAKVIKMAEQTTTVKATKPDETNAQKFVRLAELRVGNAIESIRKIALLGNKSQYEYTDDQVTAIELALKDNVDTAIKALDTGKPSGSSFKL